MKKRLVSLLLTLVMIVGALPLGGISAFAGPGSTRPRWSKPARCSRWNRR